MKFVFFVFAFLNLSALAYEAEGFSIKNLDTWSEVKGDVPHFIRDQSHLFIETIPFEKPTSLEKWIVSGSFMGSDLNMLTVRRQTYKEKIIDGVKMLRYEADITLNETLPSEKQFSFCSYLFVYENKGYSVRLFSEDKKELDAVMSTFRVHR